MRVNYFRIPIPVKDDNLQVLYDMQKQAGSITYEEAKRRGVSRKLAELSVLGLVMANCDTKKYYTTIAGTEVWREACRQYWINESTSGQEGE